MLKSVRRLARWAWSQVPNRYVGNLLSWLGLLYVPLENDLPLNEAVYKAWRRPLSRRVGWLHVFGAVALFLVLVLAITGVMLAFHYEPSQETARESVLYIMTNVSAGWLVRGVHRWAGELLVVLILVHVARTFFARAYRAPRRANWVVGLLILPVVLSFQFTGEILPWDAVAYWKSARANELGGDIPVWGNLLSHVAAGPDLSNVTLTRYFGLHTILMPWILFFLLSFHLRLVRQKGLAPPLPQTAASGANDLAMVVILRNAAEDDDVGRTVQSLEKSGATARAVKGEEKFMIHVEGCAPGVVDALALDPLVEEIVPLSQAGRGRAFFPTHFYRVVTALILTAGALLLLAAFATPTVGEAADPFERPESIRVKWYFVWFEQLREVLPDWLGFLAPLLFILMPFVGLFWPLIDRHDASGPRRRWLVPVVGGIVLGLWLALTLTGALA